MEEKEGVRGLLGPKQAGDPWPGLGRLTDKRPTDCLCVSMGNGAVLRRRPWGHPSVSRGVGGGVCGGVWYVSLPRLMDRKYSQRNNNICRI